ncbi:prepilin peptidase [Billgrantia diversa]|uniref:A24 family peptidase n=1 Tax=Halomonas sp. MCCC 1A13316 TaxID=2733487 RepID=UPI0018A642EA|nr:prepilin peptidase [Halomonas sp. MCCC 1A13316]QOR38323.1 prepilin peptidase [Halomonas sp. MCCC 1A13316]
MDERALIIGGCIVLLVGATAIWDLLQRRIPNPLVLAGAAAGLLLQGVLSGSGGILAATYGLLVGLAVFMPGYLLGFTGAGDAKLMAAVGTFMGPLGAFQAALASIMAGSMIAIGYLLFAVLFRQTASPMTRYGLMARVLVATGRPIYIKPEQGEVMGRKFPFAVAIALGTTGWMIWQWPLG